MVMKLQLLIVGYVKVGELRLLRRMNETNDDYNPSIDPSLSSRRKEEGEIRMNWKQIH
jgi:hypothetical protein